MITEQPIGQDELSELAEAAEAAGIEGDLAAWIAAHQDQLDEAAFALGAWWGERVRAITGWSWVVLGFGEGLEAPALVSEDRGVAVLPLQLAASAMEGAGPDLGAMLARLERGDRPEGPPGSYAVVA